MPPVSAKDDAPGQLLGLSPFRIFLASPGDVRYERQLAREAVEQVRGERRFRGRLTIEVIAWDQAGQAVAMEAGRTPPGLHHPRPAQARGVRPRSGHLLVPHRDPAPGGLRAQA
jgi:hypothetical protein